MKLTAKDLYKLKVIDKIIKEPQEDNTESFDKLAKSIKKEIVSSISEMNNLSKEEIVNDRYNKFRNMGEFEVL